MHDRLRELGLPEADIAALEQREREQAAKLAEDRPWARAFLQRAGIDPDDPADVRASFESCRAAHARWLASRAGEIDADAYRDLLYVIRALYGWTQWPLDWPPPTLVLMTQPLRNLLPRKTPDA